MKRLTLEYAHKLVLREFISKFDAHDTFTIIDLAEVAKAATQVGYVCGSYPNTEPSPTPPEN